MAQFQLLNKLSSVSSPVNFLNASESSSPIFKCNTGWRRASGKIQIQTLDLSGYPDGKASDSISFVSIFKDTNTPLKPLWFECIKCIKCIADAFKSFISLSDESLRLHPMITMSPSLYLFREMVADLPETDYQHSCVYQLCTDVFIFTLSVHKSKLKFV